MLHNDAAAFSQIFNYSLRIERPAKLPHKPTVFQTKQMRRRGKDLRFSGNFSIFVYSLDWRCSFIKSALSGVFLKVLAKNTKFFVKQLFSLNKFLVK